MLAAQCHKKQREQGYKWRLHDGIDSFTSPRVRRQQVCWLLVDRGEDAWRCNYGVLSAASQSVLAAGGLRK